MADEPAKKSEINSNPAASSENADLSAPKKRRRRRPRRKKRPLESEGGLLEPSVPQTVDAGPKVEEVSKVEEVPKVEEAPVPEEPKQEEEPSPFAEALKPEEKAAAPKGWDQLKEQVKDEYEQGEEIKPEPVVAAAVAATPAEDEQSPETETKEPAAALSPEIEDEEEKREVFRIIKKYVISGCLIIAVIAGILFFKLPQTLYETARDFFAGADTQQQTVTEEPVYIPTDTDAPSPAVTSSILAGEDRATSRDQFTEGVQTILITGQDVPRIRKPTSSISTALMIGSGARDFDQQYEIGGYMEVLVRLQNAFKTDVHELLNKSANRSQALAVHIRDLQSVQNEALDTIRVIKEKMDEIKIAYNQVATLRDILERDFFAYMDKLEGHQANEILEQYIEVSKRYTELRAEFSALEKTDRLFQTAVKNMDIRIKDIEYNQDVLVAGLRVVYIKGSDLDLVITEAEL